MSHSVTEECLVSAELCGKTVIASHLCNLEVKTSVRELLKIKPECGVNLLAPELFFFILAHPVYKM